MAPDDSPAATLAGVMLREQLQLKKDENLIVETWNHTLPYAAACVVEARRIGAHPVLVLEDEGAYFRSLQIGASTASWARVGTHEWALLSKTQAYVFFPGPSDRGMVDTLGPTQRQGIPSSNQGWVRKARSARVRGVRSVLGYASEPEAERYGVALPTWRGQLIAGTTQADLSAMKSDAQRVRLALKTGKVLRITAANGTDFQVRLRGREPYADDGVVRPDDVSAGRIDDDRPTGVRRGRDRRAQRGRDGDRQSTELPALGSRGGRSVGDARGPSHQFLVHRGPERLRERVLQGRERSGCDLVRIGRDRTRPFHRAYPVWRTRRPVRSRWASGGTCLGEGPIAPPSSRTS